MSFAKRWKKKDTPSSLDKLVETVKPLDPLKAKLESSIRRIEIGCQRLDQVYDGLQKQDKILFDKAVKCYKEHDEKRANVYAAEIAENRKLQKIVLRSKLALEVVALRGRTSTELGDVAVSLLPVVDTGNSIKEGIATIAPQTEEGMGELDGLLNGVVIDAGVAMTDKFSHDFMNEDTSKILDEARTIAESKINYSFPELSNKPFGQTIKEDDSSR